MALTERNLRRIVARGMTALLAALGLFAVLLVLADALPPLFPRWEKLPAPPSPVEEWAFNRSCQGDSALYVKTADGSALHLWSTRNAPWEPAYQQARGIPFSPVTEPCDFSSKAFSPLTFPPKGVRACLQTSVGDPVKSGVEAYALDSQGTLWRWHTPLNCEDVITAGPLNRLVTVLVLYGGISAGVILESWSLMWSLKKELRQARSTRSTPNQGRDSTGAENT